MQKIYCAELRCKYRCEATGLCKCKKIELGCWNVNTINMGRKDFWECKSYKPSEDYLKLKQRLIDMGIIEESNSD